MKLTGTHIVIALMAVVIAVLSWVLIYVSRDELRLHDDEIEEEIETGSAASVEQGRAIVRVDAQSQEASGIRAEALEPGQFEASVHVFGSVIDIAPLLDVRGQYLAASGERSALAAAQSAARLEYQRARALYADDRNISEQAFRDAESRYRVAEARLAAARSREAVLRASLETAWGPVISAWALKADSPVLAKLLSRRSMLVQLVFPYELPRSAAREKLMLAPVTARADAVRARFVSDAPRSNTALPGNTYFYIVSDVDLRIGARVIARVATGDDRIDGVIVPNKAVVWHAGKPWVYRKLDAETFGRYEISTANQLGAGWFQASGLQAGDEVVVSGVQLLLSEELKFQIRNENED
ncbi:MAG: hypothetical protein PVH25_12855 [Burkholderiales bacterium]|jgi:hypothetical protein